MRLDRKTAILALAFSTLLVVGAIAGYYWATITVPVEVKEPLAITGAPSILTLYAGDNKTYTLNVTNYGSAKFLVTAKFTLNDTLYQEKYVKFSNISYIVVPGNNTLPFWIYVSEEAPATAKLTLTVELSRAKPTA